MLVLNGLLHSCQMFVSLVILVILDTNLTCFQSSHTWWHTWDMCICINILLICTVSSEAVEHSSGVGGVWSSVSSKSRPSAVPLDSCHVKMGGYLELAENSPISLLNKYFHQAKRGLCIAINWVPFSEWVLMSATDT